MAQDMVGRQRQYTTDRVLGVRLRIWVRGGFWLILVSLVLWLTACRGQSDRGRATPSSSQPAVTVAIVQSLPQTYPAEPSPVPTLAATPTPPAPVVAVVNGQYILLADYERQLDQYRQALVQIGVDLDTEEGQANLAQARQDLLEGMIDQLLVEQGAAALGIHVTEEELEAQVEADIAAGGGQEAFEQWLQTSGQTREEYKQMLYHSLISQRVWESVVADVPQNAEQVHARVIVFAGEEEARQILDLLQAGGDFAALARERSLDLATKENGGDLGWFPRGVMAPEVEAVAFTLLPGQISPPIQIGDGFHLLQVVEREEARPLSEEMLALLREDRFNQWLMDLRARAVIERFVNN